MRNKIPKVVLIVFLIAAVLALFFYYRLKPRAPETEITVEVTPTIGAIKATIATTGTVLPKNRLEVKPPVSGRLDEILVREGEKVEAGQVIAWMSSTERAALLDAARGQGEESLNYWKEAYRAIPLISPIDGEVIVAKTQAGQTLTANDAVIVLSDQLIVRSQVDETDIGKVALGQDAQVVLDAYPDTKIKATVEHIYYESKIINNVTIYEVDLRTKELPEFFRSGMNAGITFIVGGKEDALLIPLEAIASEKGQSFVMVKDGQSASLTKRGVVVGISEDKKAEVISGLGKDEVVVIKTKRYALPKADEVGTNPFMPQRKPKPKENAR